MSHTLEERIAALEARRKHRIWRFAAAGFTAVAAFLFVGFFLDRQQHLVDDVGTIVVGQQAGAKRGTVIQLATCAILIKSPTNHDLGAALCDDPDLVKELRGLGIDPDDPVLPPPTTTTTTPTG